MALNKGNSSTLSPAEYRELQSKMDEKHKDSTYKGIKNKKTRLTVKINKTKKPEKRKPRIYDIDRYARE